MIPTPLSYGVRGTFGYSDGERHHGEGDTELAENADSVNQVIALLNAPVFLVEAKLEPMSREETAAQMCCMRKRPELADQSNQQALILTMMSPRAMLGVYGSPASHACF